MSTPMDAPTPRRPLEALRHREFRMLWISSGISLTGSQMQVVAINWHVWQLTHDTAALGLVGLTRVLPIILFSIFGGVAADRVDRRRLMLVTQTIMMCVAGALAWLTHVGAESLAAIYALNALSAACTAFDNPARQTIVARLVPRAELGAAVTLNLTMFHTAMIGGPGLFGLLVSGSSIFQPPQLTGAGSHVETHALAFIYLLNAVSFVAVMAALAMMKTSAKPDPAGAEPAAPMRALKDGLRFVFSTPIMVWTMSLDFFATMFAGAQSLLPVFADQILGCGPLGYGWLTAAPALGALIGSIGTTMRPLPHRQGPLLLGSVAAFGVGTIVWGLSKSYALTFAALAFTGFADLVSTVVRQTLRQLITPDSLRGRMTGVNMMFFMGGPQLGEFEAGLVARLFATAAAGAVFSVVSGGIGAIVVVGAVAMLAPVVRNYDTREHLIDHD